MGGCGLAGEQRRIDERRAVAVAGRGTDRQAAQVFQALDLVRAVVGVEQGEFDVGQRLAGVEQLAVALFGLEDVQYAIGQALLDHGQAALPGQELPFHLDPQALEHLGGHLVVDAFGLTVLKVHIGRPGFGDDTQLLAVGKGTQASEKQGGQQAGEIGHGWRLRRVHGYG
ncbi:hypothetical protein D9M71_442220 [compost metagenome]